MKSNASLIYGLVLVVGDALALVAAFILAYLLRGRFHLGHHAVAHPIAGTTYLHIFLLLLPFWILVFALMGLYSNTIQEKRFVEFGRLLIGSLIGLFFVTSYAYFSLHPVFPSKLVPVYGFTLAFIFLLAYRNAARTLRARLFRRNIGITNILLVGNTRVTVELLELLKDSKVSGYNVLGVVADKQQAKQRYPKLRAFDSFDEAIAHLNPNRIHSIVQTELYASGERNNEILEYAQTHHISFRFVPGNSELFVGNIAVELFRSQIPVIAVHQTALIGWGRIIKRLFDLILGGVFLLIALPFMVIIGSVNLFASGSVFFRQPRLTRFNHEFRVYKFRSQYKRFDGTTPEEAFARLGRPELAVQYRENGDYLDDDPRITPFGRFLRRSSLDELPQLINVVKGDISLVGPRALIPQELNKFEKKNMILAVKSGLTGLAQISGRKDLSWPERRKLDLYYVQNWSLWLDLVILAKTVRVVVRGSGAK
jgi:exopolysaccharide biosynthesis polyprenyl glycosylphosphotransferase